MNNTSIRKEDSVRVTEKITNKETEKETRIEKKISTNGLLTALQKEGYSIAWASVDKHLKKICKCAK